MVSILKSVHLPIATIMLLSIKIYTVSIIIIIIGLLTRFSIVTIANSTTVVQKAKNLKCTSYFIWIDTWLYICKGCFVSLLAKFIIVCPSITFAICIFERRTAFLIFDTRTVIGFKKYALVTPPSIYLFVWSWNCLQIEKNPFNKVYVSPFLQL